MAYRIRKFNRRGHVIGGVENPDWNGFSAREAFAQEIKDGRVMACRGRVELQFTSSKNLPWTILSVCNWAG